MQIMDIHSHTRYSDCGIDEPRVIVEAALSGGITQFGISDHNYGMGDRFEEYKSEIYALREEYAGRIRVLAGIEIASCRGYDELHPERLTGLDYCLFEHLDDPGTVVGMDVLTYRHRFPGKFGIAHTDLFRLAQSKGIDAVEFLRLFAENDIFWEMNVNYDSIHGWLEYPYVLRILKDERQQQIIRESGIRLSVGFDGHRVRDYNPQRVISMNAFLKEASIPVVEF